MQNLSAFFPTQNYIFMVELPTEFGVIPEYKRFAIGGFSAQSVLVHREDGSLFGDKYILDRKFEQRTEISNDDIILSQQVVFINLREL